MYIQAKLSQHPCPYFTVNLSLIKRNRQHKLQVGEYIDTYNEYRYGAQFQFDFAKVNTR